MFHNVLNILCGQWFLSRNKTLMTRNEKTDDEKKNDAQKVKKNLLCIRMSNGLNQ